MKLATGWQDYQILATGNGEKLEKWGNVYLLRPDPQIIWKSNKPLKNFKGLHAHYERSSDGGGKWLKNLPFPEEWCVSYKKLTFKVKPMGFKHTGLFPEQAVNWETMMQTITKANRPIKVLNLFGYTGGATVACAAAGASVCHVDAAKNMVERCKENIKLSGLEKAEVRYIVDDCRKFVQREIKRGKTYDAIIMDPPSYGRGANGEVWKLEESLYDFVELTKQVLSEKPLFVLINSYTTGLGATVLSNILYKVFGKQGEAFADEIGLPTQEENIVLPCGTSAWYMFKGE